MIIFITKLDLLFVILDILKKSIWELKLVLEF